MPTLPDSLIQKFAKVANEPPREEKDVIVYGTASISGDGTEDQEINVTLDGSETATPVTSTCVVKDGDRVTVLIKNHKAVITGNITKPSATDVDLQDAKEDIADVATTVSGFSGDIEAASTAAARAAKLAQDSLTAANGKSRNFYTADPPDQDDYDYEFQEGDTWYDIDGGYLMHDWNPTTLKWDPKPLDSQAIAVGAIKAANIDAGAITADKVAAKAISVDKLNVGDITNYVLVNENIESSMSTISGGETVVATQTLYYADTKYVAKKVATNSRLYLVYDNEAINPFRQNEEIFFSFYGKAATSGNVYFRVFAYSEDNVQIANATIEGTGTTIGLTTTDEFFSGVVKFNSVYWDTAAYYRIYIEDLRSTKSQIYLRDIKVYKRASADLIVNGAITAEKLSAGSISGDKISGGTITGGELKTTLGDTKRFTWDSVNERLVDSGLVYPNDAKIHIASKGVYVLDSSETTLAAIRQAWMQIPDGNTMASVRGFYIHDAAYAKKLYTDEGEVVTWPRLNNKLREYTIFDASAADASKYGTIYSGVAGISGARCGMISQIFLGGFSYDPTLTTPVRLPAGLRPMTRQDLYDPYNKYRFTIYGQKDQERGVTISGLGIAAMAGYIYCSALNGTTTAKSLRGSFTFINNGETELD